MTGKYHHMTSRYARLSPGTIDFCVEVIRDAHEVLHDHPDFGAAEMVRAAREILDTERWAEAHASALPAGEFRGLADYTLVCIADGLAEAADALRARGATQQADTLRGTARSLLRDVVSSTSRSPLVSYEQVFSELCAGDFDPRDRDDLTLHVGALAYALDNGGLNAGSSLRDIASLRYTQGRIDLALAIYRQLLSYDPDDVLHFSELASLCSAVHPEIARAAAQRGLALTDVGVGRVHPGLRRMVDELADEPAGPRTGAAVALLADLKAEPTRSRRTLRKLCTAVLPELERVARKERAALPDEAALDRLRAELKTLPRPWLGVLRASPAPGAPILAQGVTSAGVAKVGRNDLCPCGSGKKHKRCCGG